jgi:hypothetical protein
MRTLWFRFSQISTPLQSFADRLSTVSMLPSSLSGSIGGFREQAAIATAITATAARASKPFADAR